MSTTATATATTRAAVLEAHGATPCVREITILPPGAGQALVRVHASGVNPLDAKIHAGEAAHARHPLPAVLGIDLAGEVEAVGPGVTAFKPGDEVYGMTGGVGGVQGSLAERAVVDVHLLARKPSPLTMREAASLPLGFITAWEGLVDQAGVRAGEKVLVLGGAGAVGQLVIQLAQAFGAATFAVDSGSKRAFLERLGATAIEGPLRATAELDPLVTRYTDGKGFDVVFDAVGALDVAFNAVRRSGRVVSSLGWGTHSLAPLSFRKATYAGIFTLLPLLTGEGRARHGEILAEATKLVEAGAIVPHVDPRRFTLETVADAYRAIRERSTAGKLVVDVEVNRR